MKKSFLIFSTFLGLALYSAVFSSPLQAQTTGDPACVRAGCSGQLCVPAGGADIITTCEFRPEYACYQQASCELNSAGSCAFVITSQVQACLDNANASASPSPTVSPSASPIIIIDPVLVGDLNNDGKVNLIDYSILVTNLFSSDPAAQGDLNDDGKINLLDYSILVTNLST